MLSSRISKKYVSLIVVVVIVVIMSSILIINDVGRETKKPIRIGVEKWIGFAPLYIADEKFFKKNNVDVELVFYDVNYVDRFHDYADGKLDGLGGVYFDFIYNDAHYIKSKIVYVTDYSGKSDSIIGNVSSVSELRGKKIGIEGINTFSHFFVLKTLENSGMSEADVEFVIVPHSETVEIFKQNKIQAAHTWDPARTELIKKGYKIISSAEQNPGIITDLVGFRSQIVDSDPDKIQAIVNSLIEAEEFFDTNREESIQIIAKKLNTTTIDTEYRLSEIKILNLQENINSMKKTGDLRSLFISGKEITNHLLRQGQISKSPDFDVLIEPRFLNSFHTT